MAQIKSEIYNPSAPVNGKIISPRQIKAVIFNNELIQIQLVNGDNLNFQRLNKIKQDTIIPRKNPSLDEALNSSSGVYKP